MWNYGQGQIKIMGSYSIFIISLEILYGQYFTNGQYFTLNGQYFTSIFIENKLSF